MKIAVLPGDGIGTEIVEQAVQVLKALDLPYRVAVVCTGDLGRGQAKKYDIETWMPSRGRSTTNAWIDVHVVVGLLDRGARCRRCLSGFRRVTEVDSWFRL